MLRQLFSTALFLGIASISFSQNDQLLFSVGEGKNKSEVTLSEFKYSYEKYIGNKADYSEKSLKEYLDLYVNFKLRVLKAKDMGLAENEALKKELDGYRKQLSSSYLSEKEVVEKLVKEAYERNKKDIHVSHILFPASETADEQAHANALRQATNLKKELTTANFAAKAKEFSGDPSAATNGGDVGWFPAMQLPYELESAAHNSKEGEITGPVKTHLGYHLVWNMGSRPAYGQVQAAHILLRTSQDDEAASKKAATDIQDIYKQLQAGVPFDTLVLRHSQDNGSKAKAGVLGWFGINRYSHEFEEAAFGIKKDGEYTAPVQTAAGWHIIKRIKAVKNPTYDEAKADLTNKVKKDARFNIAQKAMVERIKKEAGFSVNPQAKSVIMDSLNNEFTTYTWKVPALTEEINNREILTVGTQKVTVKEFMQFASRNASDRIGKQPKGPMPANSVAFEAVMDKLVKETAMKYEEGMLEKKYPDFKNLMREYEEGMLRFEATKKEIWDKASADDKGMQAFYMKNPSKYKWPNRANIVTYNLHTSDLKLANAIAKFASKKGTDATVAKYDTEDNHVHVNKSVVEKDKNPALKTLKWKAGSYTKPIVANGETSFTVIESLIPSTTKTLQEARGYVVADYQDYLEQEWLKTLRSEYKVVVNDAVLQSLKK